MPSRRAILNAMAAEASLSAWPLPAFAQTPLAPTPACGDGATPAATPGPYFRPDSPLRTDITEGRAAGTPLHVGGQVTDRDCRPIPQALVDLWQADDDGRYDLAGTYLRGHQYTDDQGRWAFATIVPAPYTFRSMHLHFRVQRPRGALLTTQAFFPGDPSQSRDRQFDPRLVMTLAKEGGIRVARFDIVLA